MTLFDLPPIMLPARQRDRVINKFWEAAEKLDFEIERLRTPSTQRMTARRARQEESRLKDAWRYDLLRSKLIALAEGWKKDTLPQSLRGLNTVYQVERLLYWQGTPGKYTFNPSLYLPTELEDAGILTAEQCVTAYHDLLGIGYQGAGQPTSADRLRLLELDLVGSKIPGFFPTPPEVVQQMLYYAELRDGESVLEPSAGRGDIADAIQQAAQVQLTVLEVNYSLRGILKAKGYELAGTDFLEYRHKHEVIVMNPPFENGQDMEHVRHAATHCLAQEGRLISVMSESVFSNQGKKFVAFRKWLNKQNHFIEDLPAGAFDTGDRPTKVKTRLVILYS